MGAANPPPRPTALPLLLVAALLAAASAETCNWVADTDYYGPNVGHAGVNLTRQECCDMCALPPHTTPHHSPPTLPVADPRYGRPPLQVREDQGLRLRGLRLPRRDTPLQLLVQERPRHQEQVGLPARRNDLLPDEHGRRLPAGPAAQEGDAVDGEPL